MSNIDDCERNTTLLWMEKTYLLLLSTFRYLYNGRLHQRWIDCFVGHEDTRIDAAISKVQENHYSDTYPITRDTHCVRPPVLFH